MRLIEDRDKVVQNQFSLFHTTSAVHTCGDRLYRFLYFIEQLCVYKLNNCESDWSISSMDINNNNNNCKSEKERNILYLLVPNEE